MYHKSKKKYKDVLLSWLDQRKNSIKILTYEKYSYQINKYIIPILSDKYINKLRIEDIYSFFRHKDIKKLSNNSKNNILFIIKSSIKYSINNKYIKSFKDIDLSFKTKNNSINYFSKTEQSIIENYIKENVNLRNLVILIALYSGMRLGELCALKGNDIDFINNTITISKTVQRIKNNYDSDKKTKLIINIPKSKSSLRIVPIPSFLILLLKQLIVNKNDYIFTGSDKPKDPRSVEKYFKLLLKKLEIRDLKFHSLRHTFATRLREQKIDIKVISELLGHSDWKITESIYIHTTLDLKKDAIEQLEILWNSKKFGDVN